MSKLRRTRPHGSLQKPLPRDSTVGRGGFGRTYEAVDIDRMDDPCVIKQFMPQVQGTSALQKATQLFQQEAKRLYELGEHPQIPRLIAYFEQDKRLYLVQELWVFVWLFRLFDFVSVSILRLAARVYENLGE